MLTSPVFFDFKDRAPARSPKDRQVLRGPGGVVRTRRGGEAPAEEGTRRRRGPGGVVGIHFSPRGQRSDSAPSLPLVTSFSCISLVCHANIPNKLAHATNSVMVIL